MAVVQEAAMPAPQGTDALNSPAVTEIRSVLQQQLDRLDALGLFHAGAHLAMSIDCLESNRQALPGSKNRPFLTDLPESGSGRIKSLRRGSA